MSDTCIKIEIKTEKEPYNSNNITINNPEKSDSKDITIISSENGDSVPLSKRKIKKLKKLQEWESIKKFKRFKEREKYRKKRLESIARGEPARTGPSRKELKRKRIDPTQCKYTIAVDLSFDEFMIDKDIAKCVKQLLRVYTINRRATSPLNLYFTGLQEGTRLHKTLERNDGYKNWDVRMTNESFRQVFDLNKLIYLTSDSDNVLEELEDDKIYVIGGLVDHNHNKGLCHKIAVDDGIRHARLPLNENVLMKTRTVLSIFHVFEILLKKSEGESWQDAILHVIPQRKGAKPKNSTPEAESDESALKRFKSEIDNDDRPDVKTECSEVVSCDDVNNIKCEGNIKEEIK